MKKMGDNNIHFEKDDNHLLIRENSKLIGLIATIEDEKGGCTYIGYDGEFEDFAIHYDLKKLKKSLKEKMFERRDYQKKISELNQDLNKKEGRNKKQSKYR